MARSENACSRFVTEVAPPKYVRIVKHKRMKSLDTIIEEEESDAVEDCTSSLERIPFCEEWRLESGEVSEVSMV